jgi:hypothetical protein
MDMQQRPAHGHTEMDKQLENAVQYVHAALTSSMIMPHGHAAKM